MPVNGMNVGVDYSISYYDGTSGTLIDLGDVQDVRISAQKHDIKSMPYNAPPRYGFVPDGFKIDFTITRTGSAIEDFMVAAEASFNAGQVQSAGYLNETITNPDGSVSRYQYTGFVVFLTDHGNISRDKNVTLALTGYASTKVSIA
ncbi:hypothetical protein [Bradyrhizobium erythrophlei]|uniref:Phage tail tube protein n=1 Tax=Bradyrhizobium erythrophlei TaxID=1437360 RepID=A0A1M5NQL8_9BRAD|nr:hypothetical protein [Bradyrhizobium erythrophlei]SHG91735.1 hypothetical protein SAMN05443248_3079 [Bradyrhizobium erythrophlei]